MKMEKRKKPGNGIRQALSLFLSFLLSVFLSFFHSFVLPSFLFSLCVRPSGCDRQKIRTECFCTPQGNCNDGPLFVCFWFFFRFDLFLLWPSHFFFFGLWRRCVTDFELFFFIGCRRDWPLFYWCSVRCRHFYGANDVSICRITQFYWFLPSFIAFFFYLYGFVPGLPSFTELHPVFMVFTQFTEFY